jgi:flagellar basal-body rod modification protein FlgD
MTTVPATSSSTAATGSAKSNAASAASSTTVDYDSFLKLLVQELKNQDPTSPSDPTQYLSQIATFSNVEQGVNTNNKLSTLLTTSSLSQAESTIGRKVMSADGSTSGIVSAVALDTDGSAVALLTNGSMLTLDGTVVISSSDATGSTGTTSSPTSAEALLASLKSASA